MEVGVPCLICGDPAPAPAAEQVIFLLRQVFQVPEALFTKIVEESIASGSVSSLTLCETCREVVGECQAVHKQWNECRARVVRKVKVTAAQGEEEDEAGSAEDAMRLETRQFVVHHVYAFTETLGEEEEEDVVDDDSGGESGVPAVGESGDASTTQETAAVTGGESGVQREGVGKARKRTLTGKRLRHDPKNRSSDKRRSLDCLFCPRKCKSASSLEEHLWVHTDERPFWCGVCGKEFATKRGLHLHHLVHSGEKPHQCELCPKQFNDRRNLSRHLRTHLGEKSWKCPDCGKAFVTKCDLGKHRRGHTGEKPFQCDLCPRKYSASGGLSRHKKINH